MRKQACRQYREMKTSTNAGFRLADLKLSGEALKGAVQDAQKKILAAETPSTIHTKGIHHSRRISGSGNGNSHARIERGYQHTAYRRPIRR
jgi:hypothetical protein